jgi:hypothetical protein
MIHLKKDETIQTQVLDQLGELIDGASSEQLHMPSVPQVEHPLPKLIEMATKKYESNSYNTIRELRATAANLQAVAEELIDAANQIERDQPFFKDTIGTVVRFEMESAEKARRFSLIKPSKG